MGQFHNYFIQLSSCFTSSIILSIELDNTSSNDSEFDTIPFNLDALSDLAIFNPSVFQFITPLFIDLANSLTSSYSGAHMILLTDGFAYSLKFGHKIKSTTENT